MLQRMLRVLLSNAVKGLGVAAVMLLLAPFCYSQSTAILIIDDMGNSMPLGERALMLPGKVNFSFLPHTPNSRELAEDAHAKGQEVMLHLPMSNLNGAPTGPGKLSPSMDKEQFMATLRDNLAAVPYARGVNNHMGSLLTQLHQPMEWLMEGLKLQRLYFIDSRTSPLTVAERKADDKHVPVLRRDVFLDNSLDPANIEKQFERWIKLSQKRGFAVAIAHPHPETLTVLEQRLPELKQRGVRLLYASEVLNQRIATTRAPTETPEDTARN